MFGMQQPDGIVEGWHGDGNFARTALMYGLWKTQGARLSPWKPYLRLGAVASEKPILSLARKPNGKENSSLTPYATKPSSIFPWTIPASINFPSGLPQTLRPTIASGPPTQNYRKPTAEHHCWKESLLANSGQESV